MEYTLSIALVDYIPVFALLVASYFLVKIALLVRGKPTGRMMMAGTLLIFTGGFLKATWKLLYAIDIADIKVFSELQFALLGPGFLAMLVAVIYITRDKQAKTPVLMAMAPWKIPFLALMTLGSLGAQGILTYISFKRGNRLAAAFFIIAVLCMLAMSGMASGAEQTVATQWIEETINSMGQISFAFGSFILYRSYVDSSKKPASAG